jgi:hypothetical protein
METRLPERRALRNFTKQLALPRIARFHLRQQSTSRALLQHLHHRRRRPDLRFALKKVDVFRHYDISHHREPVALAGFF